jgi:hypothetical protein
LPIPSPDVVARELGEEVVLVHLRTNRIFALNATGARFWQLLIDGASRSEIESSLKQEYDVSDDEIGAEIDDLVAELAQEGIVVAAAAG